MRFAQTWQSSKGHGDCLPPALSRRLLFLHRVPTLLSYCETVTVAATASLGFLDCHSWHGRHGESSGDEMLCVREQMQCLDPK